MKEQLDTEIIKEFLPGLSVTSTDLLAGHATISNMEKRNIFLHTGQYVKMLPVVVSGLVKVFSSSEDKGLLLYYIKPGESCIMSFSSGLTNQLSRINANSEDESVVLLIPVRLIPELARNDPGFTDMFFLAFNNRYQDLIETINQLIFMRMDERLLDYLKQRARLHRTSVPGFRHHEIAKELGTAREVVSPVVKKQEKKEKLKQAEKGTKILHSGDIDHR